MSMIPSLSVWSSVKFPFPKYFSDNKIKKPYSADSCDHFIKRNYEKSRAETAAEMINLRVPCNVEKENSVPNLYCECTRRKQISSKHKQKNRHIRFVIVPQIIFYDKECAISNKESPAFQEVNFEEKDEESDVGGSEEIRSVPSVKPWTLEELVEINRQKEEAKKKREAKKNKMREDVLKAHVGAHEISKETLRSKENLTFPTDTIYQHCFSDFTKHGDCEMYHSKLDLNSDYMEMVHKTR